MKTGPLDYWEVVRTSQRLRHLGPLWWGIVVAGTWRWTGGREPEHPCKPPDFMPGDVPAGLIWRCPCEAEWRWEPR